MRRLIIAGLYCVVVLIANLTATIFLPLPWFGLVSVGTLAFGATFTLRDYAHCHGRRFVYTMIAAAAVVSGLAVAVTDTSARVVGASVLSIILAESADTEVYQRLMARSWWVRVLGSNSVSVPLDTLLFTSIAFAGVLPRAELLALGWGDTLVKFGIAALIALGGIYGTTSDHRPPASASRDGCPAAD